MFPSVETIVIALAAGVLPALLWLWFWMREDRRCPEPKGLIALAFIAGMLTVFAVIPLEYLAASILSGTLMIAVWAALEELLKVAAAYLIVLRNKEMNEPIDAVIYMITVALGFAALENALFLLTPLRDGLIAETLLTGNFRFIGAMLLHTLSSATVGIALALTFYKRPEIKRAALIIGLVLATALHTLFNFFIIETNGEKLLTIFLFVWIGIIVVILLLEHIKHLRKPPSRAQETSTHYAQK